MRFRWLRLLPPAGLTSAMFLASPFSWAADSPVAAASLEAADVATGHMYNALLYLPTGFVLAVMSLEFFAQWKKNREVEPAILFLLFGATGVAVGVAGLALAFSPIGRNGQVQSFVTWMGLAAGVMALAFYLKRQARNRRLFSLNPVPALSGRIALPRTGGQRGLIIGYRITLICAFLLSLLGVSEMPLSHARTASIAESLRSINRSWNDPAPAVAAAGTTPAGEAPPTTPSPKAPETPSSPSLATLLGNGGQPAPAQPTASNPPPSPATPQPAAPSNPAAAATTPPESPATTPPPESGTAPPESPAMAETKPAGTAATPPNTPAAIPAPPKPATASTAASPTRKLPANFFASKIKPVLDAKCVDCHGASKQKGDLRLDSVAAIKKGAGHPIVVGGDLELSTIYQRLITPDDEDLMPPRDKGGPLAPNVIAAFKAWVEAGADFGDGAAAPGKAPATTATPGGKLEEEKSKSLQPPPADLLARLTEGGAVIRPMSANGALIDVNLTHYESGPVNLADLTPIAKNVLSLDVSRTKLKDPDLAPLAGMTNLVRLELKRNTITDAGLVHLKGLTELESLNLFDTQVSDAGVDHLTGLKKLKKIFLFNSKVTAAGADRLRAAIPGVVVNLGE